MQWSYSENGNNQQPLSYSENGNNQQPLFRKYVYGMF